MSFGVDARLVVVVCLFVVVVCLFVVVVGVVGGDGGLGEEGVRCNELLLLLCLCCCSCSCCNTLEYIREKDARPWKKNKNSNEKIQ